MALVFEQINSEGLAQLSYIVGDDKAGVAAVIDPRRDVEIYVEKANSLGVRITHADRNAYSRRFRLRHARACRADGRENLRRQKRGLQIRSRTIKRRRRDRARQRHSARRSHARTYARTYLPARFRQKTGRRTVCHLYGRHAFQSRCRATRSFGQGHGNRSGEKALSLFVRKNSPAWATVSKFTRVTARARRAANRSATAARRRSATSAFSAKRSKNAAKRNSSNG